MKRLLLFIIALPLLFALKSAVPSPPDNSEVTEDALCFSRDILPIFNSNCAMAKCHDAITHEEGFTLTSYSGIMKGIKAGNASQSKLYREISENEMPPDYNLPDSLKKRISTWIQQGALNNDCTPQTCDTTNISLQKSIRPIIAVNCLGCHSGNTPSGGIDLSSDDRVEELKEMILCSITHGQDCKAMPPNNVNLTTCDVSKFRIWALGTETSVQESETNSELSVTLSQSNEKLSCFLPQGISGNIKVNIITLNGLSVYSYKHTVPEQSTHPIVLDIEKLAKGFYILQVTSGTRSYAARFIK